MSQALEVIDKPPPHEFSQPLSEGLPPLASFINLRVHDSEVVGMAEEDPLRVVLRVYPDIGSPHCSGRPDFDDVMRTLGVREDDPTLSKVHIGEDSVLLFFASGPPLDTREDDARWKAPEYRTATRWLAERSIDSAQKVRDSGLKLDLVASYPAGPIPVLLLDELSRLGIELWVFELPPPKDPLDDIQRLASALPPSQRL